MKNEIMLSQNAAPAPFVDPVKSQAMQLRLMREQADILVKSGLLPKAVNTPEKAIAIQMMAKELGIGTFEAFSNIHVIEGTPTVSPKLHLALAMRSGQVEVYDVAEGDGWCEVTIKRRGHARPTKTKWTSGEARKAGLTERQMWQKYPANMLRWRTIGFALDVTFPDLIGGLRKSDAADFTPSGDLVDPAPADRPHVDDEGTADAQVVDAEIIEGGPAGPLPVTRTPDVDRTTRVRELFYQSVPAVWPDKNAFAEWLHTSFGKRLAEMLNLTDAELEHWESVLHRGGAQEADDDQVAAEDDLPFEQPEPPVEAPKPAQKAPAQPHTTRRTFRGA